MEESGGDVCMQELSNTALVIRSDRNLIVTLQDPGEVVSMVELEPAMDGRCAQEFKSISEPDLATNLSSNISIIADSLGTSGETRLLSIYASHEELLQNSPCLELSTSLAGEESLPKRLNLEVALGETSVLTTELIFRVSKGSMHSNERCNSPKEQVQPESGIESLPDSFPSLHTNKIIVGSPTICHISRERSMVQKWRQRCMTGNLRE
eukprot:Gb_18292 [translate_table: standard]